MLSGQHHANVLFYYRAMLCVISAACVVELSVSPSLAIPYHVEMAYFVVEIMKI